MGDLVRIGIGLPTTIPWATPQQIVGWAKEADAAGFSTLGTIDRVVYGNYETIPALAAAAAVTERIGLTTSILLAPFRGNGALLAKELATIDVLSGGRLTVGLAPGTREDDFTATGVDFHRRGRIFDAQLREMRAVWEGAERGMWGPIGPSRVTPGGPPLLFGGGSDAAWRRMVEYGAGWIAGGGGLEQFAQGAETARAAWREGGRAGEPRLAGLAYYALGPDAGEQARRYLSDYYGYLGEWVDAIVESALTTPEVLREHLAAFADAGCDELILFPCNPDVGQVGLLADAAGVSPA
jgi:alkanesulfonate monooxygenase SsuD/methylene tetrahydromethanopterin reductase-like flavin-dependent oxidoreductase (luciferase family)